MSFKDKLVGVFSEDEEEVSKDKGESEEPKKVDAEEEIEVDFKEVFNKLKKILSNKYVYYVLLIPILLVGLYIRLGNMVHLKGKYLMGLDPYYFYRLTEYLLENGRLMQLDLMRLAPVGYDTPFRLFPYILAVWHKFVSIFSSQPQMYSHIIYPPVFAILGFLFFFLLIREIWGGKVALISTAFFAVVPGYLYRTMAGFADHETAAMLFLFVSLWLFVKFRKEDDIKKKLIFASLSGIAASMMALLWPGVTLITISLSVFISLEILFETINKKYFIGYIAWIAFFSLPILVLIGVNSLINVRNIVVFFPLVGFVVYYVLKKINILKNKFLGLQALILSAVLSIIGVLLIYDVTNIFAMITSPGGAARVSRTTSEIIGGVNLWGTFSWILIFAILGALYLIYQLFKENKKELVVAEIFAIVSLIILLLLRGSGAVLRLTSFALIIVIIVILYLFHSHVYKKREFIDKSKSIYIIPLILFLVTAYLSQTAARFVFIIAPFVCLMAGYFLVSATKELYSQKNLRLLSILILIIIAAIFFVNADTSYNQGKNTGSRLPGQWEQSMVWLRNNTPEGSVVSHWWDYGYWTQAVAERPSTEDGGKGDDYWIYTLARYGMVGFDDTEVLTYFKSHNVSYLLYSWEEIGKYHAFSYLASHDGPPGEYDRESVIGIFSLVQEQEIRNGTRYLYQGGWTFDQDIVIDDLVIPENKAGVGGFFITLDENKTLIKAPEAIIVYNEQQFNEEIGCVYMNGEKQTFDTNSTLDGCIVFTDLYPNEQQKIDQGTIIFLSNKVYPGLLARLYIIGEEVEGYEEVYSDDTPLGIFRNRIVGPIKIWKINYPENITVDPSFIEIPEDFKKWYS